MASIATVLVVVAAFFGMQTMKSDSAGSSTSSNTSAASVPDGAQRPGGGTQGTIQSIDGSTLIVETSDGDTVTVTTNDDTTVTTTDEGSVADIAVGDNLMVTGSTSGSSTAAETIVDNGTAELGGELSGAGSQGNGQFPSGDGNLPQGAPDGGDFTPPTMGSVTSIDNDTITLETSDGSTVTVTTTSSTDVTMRRTAALSDLAEGDSVLVMGDTSGDTVTATAISEGDRGFGGGGFPGAPGGPSSGNRAG